MSLLEPKMEKLMQYADSRFTLVMEVSKRGRQINEYFGSFRRQEFTNIRGPEITAVNRQPLSVAMEEVAEGKIKFHRVVDGIK